ncbi:MAG: prepilin-type N-terminal cleavage/methylation domain-containing protein [Planctomycetes bacterium]|nr:prepilin-type N-terminal cleavage/methylation domain-containing protein [Planctomycetota bacterium]
MNRRGFTLIEALATVVLVAIVLPVAMRGVSAALALGESAAMRQQATVLAEGKLAEMVTTGLWRGGDLSGDFSTSALGESLSVDETRSLTWSVTSTDAPWDQLRQISVKVMWMSRGYERNVTLTTLVDEENAP